MRNYEVRYKHRGDWRTLYFRSTDAIEARRACVFYLGFRPTSLIACVQSPSI